LRAGDRCQIDFDPNPLSCIQLPSAPGDMGDPTDVACGDGDPTVMGLGAFGGSALTCTRECTSSDMCQDISAKLHVPMSCPPAPAATPNATRYCLPVVPYKTACDPNASAPGDCFGNLSCLPDVDQPGTNVCTISCMTSDDCTQEPTLGSTFTCASGECVPKIPAGCAATNADSCISGQLAGGNCVSPLNWACTADAQCASGHCLLIDGTSPAFGRCE
jgi:hypothetical protein